MFIIDLDIIYLYIYNHFHKSKNIIHMKDLEQRLDHFSVQEVIPAGFIIEVGNTKKKMENRNQKNRQPRTMYHKQMQKALLSKILAFYETLSGKYVIASHVSRQLRDMCNHYGAHIVVSKNNYRPRYVNGR